MKKFQKNEVSGAVLYLLSFIFICVLVEIVNFIDHHRLCDYGIFPRQLSGLTGIIAAPFLHYGWEHLITNMISLLFLGGITAVFYPKFFLRVTVLVIVLGGAGVWLIGRAASHVGASGLLFGYFGFLISRGIYERTFTAIVISILVIVIYGGMIYGLLPLSPYVSWEAHLCGFLAGIVAARVIKIKGE
jgi:membrane associated rhomboid family serine protease